MTPKRVEISVHLDNPFQALEQIEHWLIYVPPVLISPGLPIPDGVGLSNMCDTWEAIQMKGME